MNSSTQASPTFLAIDAAGIPRAAPRDDGSWAVQRIALASRPHALAAATTQRIAYAGTTNGVLRSEDGGLTWQPAGLVGRDVRAVAASPVQPGLLFAGARPCALFTSLNRGDTWTELPAFRRLARFRAFFSPAEWPPIPYVSAIALSAGDARRVVVGMEVGGVAASADGGATWRVARGAIYDCHSLAAHPRDPLRFYQGGAGLAKAGRTSSDGGITWSGPRSVDGRSYGWASLGDPANPDTWYYSASSGPFQAHGAGRAAAVLHRVRDGRVDRVRDGLPGTLANMPYQLLAHDDALYMGLANGDIWRSGVGGESWHKLDISLGRIERALIAL